MSEQDPPPVPAVLRQDGVTGAERYLKRLCDRTFLSLWSYPGVYRDQGQTAKSREGKEVCDLLVVCGEHVVIFSDKDCQFPDSGDPVLDWKRWYRRAVLKSAEQVWGAERWIRTHPDRLFLDRSCTRRFPLGLPDPAVAKFHRVVVAHDSTRRCRAALGGSGSLMIFPDIVGDMHYSGDNVRPFAVGQVDPARGYVHILDDTTLDVLLRTLDTIADFVTYLSRKERLVASGRLVGAAGEEDLLAYYLRKVDDRDEHDFVVPPGITHITVDEGLWEELRVSPQRRAQVEADGISYLWDRMIERFAGNILAGTGERPADATVADQERVIRLMAREPRLRRRMLAGAVVGLIEKAPHDRPLFRATRVILPSRPGDPYHVFLLLTGPEGETAERYRLARRNLLEMVCMAVKVQFPDATDIVGYATEPGPEAGRTEDALYLDARDWTAEQQAEAEEVREKLGLLTQLERFEEKCREYPVPTPSRKAEPGTGKRKANPSMRNSDCPCGSGLKFKKCCRRRQGW